MIWEPENFENLKTWKPENLKTRSLSLSHSLFKVENVNGFFWDILITLSSDIRVHRAGSQLKMSESQTGATNLKTLKTWKLDPENLKTWT